MDRARSPHDSGRNRPYAFGEADVRELLRLISSLHGPASSPSERKRRLIEGVCRLVGADAGVCLTIRVDPDTADREVVSVVRAGATPHRARLAKPPGRAARAGRTGAGAGPAWHHSPDGESLLRASGIAQQVVWGPVPVGPPGLGASLVVGRHGGGNRRAPFGPRDHAIVRVAHAESAWLYAADAALASPGVLALPPRRRHVLQYLLAGENEADVAGWLGMRVEEVRSEARAASRILGPPLNDHLSGR
jgi:hypothetical protein